MKDINTPDNDSNELTIENIYSAIAKHIHQARTNVIKAVNAEQVLAYWHIGKIIVTQEQAGENRARYGKALLENLSTRLQKDFGKGFGITNLKYMRQFYLTYQNRIGHEVRDEFDIEGFDENLSWTHYRLLIKELRPEVRRFYEIEASKNGWSTPQLERQMTSFLFERLAASKDTKSIMKLASDGQIIQKPEDSLKNPYVLDFLGYKEHHSYTETDLESAIIDHLQDFLLELGSGFAFIARQKRITVEGEIFKPDLIFYHTILKCYTIIDLKTTRLKHENVGQMMMYVNYYDREVKRKDDNPTIGLLLCAEHNETAVKYTLPEGNQQIFSRKYQLHLPTIEELKQEVEREYKEAIQRLSLNEKDKQS
ncbi:MAG: YhcG family protein [Gammaproteobacteria bacterium]